MEIEVKNIESIEESLFEYCIFDYGFLYYDIGLCVESQPYIAAGKCGERRGSRRESRAAGERGVGRAG